VTSTKRTCSITAWRRSLKTSPRQLEGRLGPPMRLNTGKSMSGPTKCTITSGVQETLSLWICQPPTPAILHRGLRPTIPRGGPSWCRVEQRPATILRRSRWPLRRSPAEGTILRRTQARRPCRWRDPGGPCRCRQDRWRGTILQWKSSAAAVDLLLRQEQEGSWSLEDRSQSL
jgi:hypothetical protein